MQKSIVLVTVDCLRADHVGFMGYERGTTPFLDSLAGESFVFPAAVAAGAPTYYSFPAILGSRYPLALGRDVLGLGPDEPTLASALKDAGYVTASFGAANPYISARFGYARGFDAFQDFLNDAPEPLVNERPIEAGKGWVSRFNRNLQKINSKLGPFRSVYDELYFQYCQRTSPVADSLDALRRFPAADVLVDHASRWLPLVGTAPFFLWLHLMDPHGPYYPTDAALRMMGQKSITPFRARYLNSYWNRSDLGPGRLARHRKEIVALYDAGIRWVDFQMERLVGALRKSGRWENCVFAFTADHGEEFLDHGGRYHPPSRLMEELIHVPLMVHVPGITKRKPAQPFSLLHLAPTLLDAAGVAVPRSFQGHSYFQHGGEDLLAISECVAGCTNPFRPENRLGPRVLSVRDAHYKLLLTFEPRGEHFYDLEADPKERSPLPTSEVKSVRRRMLEAAREHVRRPIDQRTRAQRRLCELQLEWKAPAPKTSPANSQLTTGRR